MTNKDIEKMKNNIDELVENLKLKQEKIQDLAAVNMQLQVERNELRQLVEDLQEKISDLQSELSVKENLMKIRSSVDECQDAVGFLLHSEPISVAEQLINANYERKLSDLEKSLRKVTGCDCETTIETVYSVSELRQIAEHLLVYCNHNSEEDNE